MWSAVRGSWALLLGVGVLMLGNGLLQTLLGVRASLEQFPSTVTGVVQSSYFAGFLAGSLISPMLLRRVGHIRTFAALASLASTTSLIHAVQVDVVTWAAMRLVSGLCFAGLYVVAESWLNDSATNDNRGQLLSIYVIIQNAGLAAGQGLLNLSDPGGYDLFILVSVLVSIALLPILVTASPAPAFTAPEKLRFRELYEVSPLGVVGIFGSGLSVGAFFAMGAVYANQIGLALAGVSLVMAAFTLGGTLLQWPVGRLSDRIDRRSVIVLVNASALILALFVATGAAGGTILFGLVFVLGGVAMPTYALSISHTNDFLPRGKVVAASSGLVLLWGAAAAVGPLMASGVMQAFGAQGLFWWIGGVHATVAAFALYRMTRRRARPLDEQAPYVALTTGATQVATTLSPESDPIPDDAPVIEGGPWFGEGGSDVGEVPDVPRTAED